MAVRELERKPRAEAVVAKALVRAAQRLGLSQGDLAAVLGTSAASVSRTWNGERPIAPDSAEGRHALLFLRVFRSLDTLVGGDEEKAQRWLASHDQSFPSVRQLASLVHARSTGAMQPSSWASSPPG